MFSKLTFFVVCIVFFHPGVALSQEKESTEISRPKIGLVLSGGGARGSAHIGVIEVLEELHVPIDMIVGTSIGAVIGGMYASGIPIQHIKRLLSTLDWEDAFKYEGNRLELYYRRKLDDDLFLVKNFISISDGKLGLSSGVTDGQSLYQIFNSSFFPYQPTHFAELPIPFKAVTTDLITGKTFILERGDLSLAILTSMAVPGIISPIAIDNYLLVDGGSSENLPIEIAKKMGADILIVVDVSTSLSKKEDIKDMLSVLGQVSNILTNINIQRSKFFLTAQDILITPNLGNIETADFDKFSQGILPGRKAALQVAPRLEELSQALIPRLKLRSRITDETVDLNGIIIKNATPSAKKVITHYGDLNLYRVSDNKINDTISYLYGLDIFDHIYYGIDKVNEEKYLIIEPQTNERGSTYVQGSILLASDFQGENDFSIVLGLTNTQFNSLMGEWRIVGSLGEKTGVFSEIYQPLSPSLSWFINPFLYVQREPLPLYFDFESIARYLNTGFGAGFRLGRGFANWGRIVGFWQFEYDDFVIVTGSPLLPEGKFKEGELGIAFEWDVLDNVYFPHYGSKGTIRFATNKEVFGGNDQFTQLSVKNINAVTIKNHSFVLAGMYNATLHGAPKAPGKYFLGGLFQLTGLADNEIFGNNAAEVSAIVYSRIGQIKLIPNRPAPLYIGFSLEGGKVWKETNLSANHSMIKVGSLFVGLDTLIGPIYFAAGATENGKKALHFVLGPLF